MNNYPKLIFSISGRRNIHENVHDMSPGIIFQLEIEDKRYLWLKSGMAYMNRMIKNVQVQSVYDEGYHRINNIIEAIDSCVFSEIITVDEFNKRSFNEIIASRGDNSWLSGIKREISDVFDCSWLEKNSADIISKCLLEQKRFTPTYVQFQKRLTATKNNNYYLRLADEHCFPSGFAISESIKGIGMCIFRRDKNRLDISAQLPHDLYPNFPASDYPVPPIDPKFGRPKTGFAVNYVSKL